MSNYDDFGRPLKTCDNPLCDRRTKQGIMYCCGSCDAAHRGQYEIHESGPLAHSPSCNDRHEQRRNKPGPQSPIRYPRTEQ